MTKQSIELLEAAAKLRLNEDGIKRTHRLCEKLGRRNMRRNHIVHGAWGLLTKLYEEGATNEWVRQYSNTDPSLAALMPTDPKLIGIYNFTIPELDRATDHVEEMVLELSALGQDIPQLLVQPRTPEGSSQN